MKYIALIACLAVLGCGDDDSGPTDAATPDVAFDTESADAPTALDGGDSDAGSDAGEADSGDDAAATDAGDDATAFDAGTDAGDDAGMDAGPQDAGPPLTCMRTGCSAQVCAEMPVFTTCEFRPWYVCYADALCEEQPGRTCGWTPTDALLRCLEENGAPDAP